MQTIITLLLFFFGWWAARTVGLLLAATPTIQLRRGVMGAVTVECVVPVGVLAYIGEVPAHFVLFAAFLAAAIGFLLSQRADRTVRIWGTLATVPFVVAVASAALVFIANRLRRPYWIFTDSLTTAQWALASSVAVGFVAGLCFYVPALLWKSRRPDAVFASPRKSVTVTIAVGALVAVCSIVYDIQIRRDLDVMVRSADVEQTRILGVDLDAPVQNNVGDDYIAIVESTLNAPGAEQVHANDARRRVGETREHGLIDALRKASESDKSFRYDPESPVAECFFDTIGTLCSELATQAEASTDLATMRADALVLRRCQRHLSQDPRTPAIVLEGIERHLRSLFETLCDDKSFQPILSRYSNFDLPDPVELSQVVEKARIARTVHRLHAPDGAQRFSKSIFFFLNRLLWAERDLSDVAEGLAAVTLPSGYISDQLSIDLSDRRRLYQMAAVNDAGQLLGCFYRDHGRLPGVDEQAQLFASNDMPQESIVVSPLSDGGLVTFNDPESLMSASVIRRIDEQERPLDSYGSVDRVRSASTSVFLIGGSKRRFRGESRDVIASDHQRIMLFSPTAEQLVQFLSDIQDRRYADAIARLTRTCDKKEQTTVHDRSQVLERVLDDNHSIANQPDVDAGWFDHIDALTVRHDAEEELRLVFWTPEKIALRNQALRSVRRTDVYAGVAELRLHSDLVLPTNTEQLAWNELSLLAEFLEWANQEQRPVLCVTVRPGATRRGEEE